MLYDESQRLELQNRLDAMKSPKERNMLGQFSTPPMLAREIVSYGLDLLGQTSSISFLDPAFGTGSFLSALEATKASRCLSKAVAFEVDSHYGAPSRTYWTNHKVDIRLCDFTAATPDGEDFNFVICNPPYVRHHHLSTQLKLKLKEQNAKLGVKLSGLAGLYCHFMVAAQRWMAKGAVAGWLIPSEFMDVNYGVELKRYLLDHVTLLRIHRFEPSDLQFEDALVSSAVVWLKNDLPPKNHQVRFSLGGSHGEPTESRFVSRYDLLDEPKWTRFPRRMVRRKQTTAVISDFFEIKRGIATGDNKFFIIDKKKCSELEIPEDFLQPVLPSPRSLTTSIIEADENQNPVVDEPRFLINCRLPETELKRKHSKLWNYLESGRNTIGQRYLCSKRRIWYLQEQRQAAPFLCTYMGRGTATDQRPVRFVLNKSRAIVTNSFLMLYPKHEVQTELEVNADLIFKLHAALNEITDDVLRENGRVYGGGLHKIEPSELANLPAGALECILGNFAPVQKALFKTESVR